MAVQVETAAGGSGGGETGTDEEAWRASEAGSARRWLRVPVSSGCSGGGSWWLLLCGCCGCCGCESCTWGEDMTAAIQSGQGKGGLESDVIRETAVRRDGEWADQPATSS